MTEEREANDGQTGDHHDEPDHDGEVHEPSSVVAPRRHKRAIRAAVAGTILVALVAAAAFVPLPYLVYSPGSVRATEPRITVEGLAADTGEGEILFTTVLQQQGTPFRLFRSWIDDTIDVQKEEDARGDSTPEEDRAINQYRMDDSKSAAVIVALTALGYDVEIEESGAFVERFFDDLPAQDVLQLADVIVAIDGNEIKNVGDVDAALSELPAGAEIQVTVRRNVNGESVEETRSLELGSNPDDDSHGYMGVQISTVESLGRLPVQLELDSGSVIGPSAGLAWSLGVIDRLTEGDLTNGRRVAVTGTISRDGSVGPIGGLAQKTAAVKRAGAQVFIVPAVPEGAGDDQRAAMNTELTRAREIAGDELEIVPVRDIDEALAVVAPDGLPELTVAA